VSPAPGGVFAGAGACVWLWRAHGPSYWLVVSRWIASRSPLQHPPASSVTSRPPRVFGLWAALQIKFAFAQHISRPTWAQPPHPCIHFAFRLWRRAELLSWVLCTSAAFLTRLSGTHSGPRCAYQFAVPALALVSPLSSALPHLHPLAL
jgi:hypothetical protein